MTSSILKRYVVIAAITFALPATASAADSWPGWRGPDFDGKAAAAEKPPTQWDESTNVVWRASVPGRGHSSPTVSGDFIFLTTADERTQTQSVLCYRRSNGEPLWKRDVNQGDFNPKIHPKNTHATPTPATDGKLVYVTFNNHTAVQLVALDFEGNVVWQKIAGEYRPKQYQFGYAPSPLLYKDTVIVASEFESNGYLAAFNTVNGKEVWRTKRPQYISFSTPVVARVAGKEQLLISGANMVASYDPKTGKPSWSVKGTTNATCGTMIWDNDMVYASGGYPANQTIAVSGNGSRKVAWQNSVKCYEQSMLISDGYVYAVSDDGIAFCWQAKSGREMWKTRLAGPVSASPVLANGNIYLANEGGTMFVFKANPQQFEEVARNQLGTEAFATPAFVGNQIIARVASGRGGNRQEFLYCLGE
jgi:outer membrane protein assembly factor BamB